MSLWRHLRALMLPVTVLGLAPALILRQWGSRAPQLGSANAGQPAAAVAGVALMAAGLALTVWAITLFGRLGRGTLAPWDPTQKLVIRGPYQYVRNPMILGVLLVLAGECLVFRTRALVVWAVAVLAMNLVYMPLLEERGLGRRFGEAYRIYKRHVRAWVPRLRAWAPPDEG